MIPVIREYRLDDYDVLMQCLTGLQGFIHALDPLERVRGVQDFDARSYTDVLIQGVQKKGGVIFLAEDDGSVCGCAAGWIIPEDDEDLLGHYPSQSGRVVELFVSDTVRGKGVGSMLMRRMEEYFRTKGCDSVRVEVFSGNDAHAFYAKIGYSDRCIDMMKML